MDHTLEYQLRLKTESENDSLNSWSIEEVDSAGRIVGVSKQVPWTWNLDFDLLEVSYVPKIEIGENLDDAVGAVFREEVEAKLQPAANPGILETNTTFSMFGTRRLIREFKMRILPSRDDSEYARVEAIPQYEFDDGIRKDTSPDRVTFLVKLKREMFDRLVGLVESKNLSSACLTVGCVDGFYSGFSPDIFTSHIKILTGRHDIEIPRGCGHDPFITSNVGEFSLSLKSSQKLGISS